MRSVDSYASAKPEKKVLIMSVEISVTHSKLHMIFFMYVAAIQRLNYGGQDLKKHTYFVVYVSDTPVTLKQG